MNSKIHQHAAQKNAGVHTQF